MPQVSKAAARLRREERGLTLVELMIAAAVGLVVVGGALTMFIGAVHSEPRTSSKAAAIQQARVTVDRITRELRQGIETVTTSPSQLALITYVKEATCGGAAATASIPCEVTYTCSAGKCTRLVAPPNGIPPSPAVQVASGLASSNVFSYVYPPESSDPSYVGVSLAFDSEGQPVTLTDGVALRNPSEES
jgi:Tfp pilus assembly protein PilV